MADAGNGRNWGLASHRMYAESCRPSAATIPTSRPASHRAMRLSSDVLWPSTQRRVRSTDRLEKRAGITAIKPEFGFASPCTRTMRHGVVRACGKDECACRSTESSSSLDPRRRESRSALEKACRAARVRFVYRRPRRRCLGQHLALGSTTGGLWLSETRATRGIASRRSCRRSTACSAD